LNKLAYRLFAFLFFISFQFLQAQEDNLDIRQNSSKIDSAQIESSLQKLKARSKFLFKDSTGISRPARAALLSAVVPGLGQIYTKKLWYLRLAAIYGIGGFLGYTISNDHQRYVELRDAHLYQLDNNPITEPDPKFDGYNSTSLKRNRDRYRRNRDYYVLLLMGVYVLNIAEAATMAHLNEFSITDDLALKVKPHFETINGQPTAGIALRIAIQPQQKTILY